jgi:hypothetical protein
MIFTHTGLMGDFVLTWPIASWFLKTKREKIDFVLPDISCFSQIDRLLLEQPFTNSLTKVPYKVLNYNCGGQPYKFNPEDFGIKGEYRNLGFRSGPPLDKWCPYFVADEHGFGVDEEFQIKIFDIVKSNQIYACNPIISTEKELQFGLKKKLFGSKIISKMTPSNTHFLSPENDLYFNLSLIKSGYHTYVSEGGLSIILDLMNVDYTVFSLEEFALDEPTKENLYYKPNNSKRRYISLREEDFAILK